MKQHGDLATYREGTARAELVRRNERLRKVGEVRPFFVPTRMERLVADELILLARALKRELGR